MLSSTSMADKFWVMASLKNKCIGDTSLRKFVTFSSICAASSKIYYANPASHQDFNNHPTQMCWIYHPWGILIIIGCSVHNCVLDVLNRCAWCEHEKCRGKWEDSIPLNQKKWLQRVVVTLSQRTEYEEEMKITHILSAVTK